MGGTLATVFAYRQYIKNWSKRLPSFMAEMMQSSMLLVLMLTQVTSSINQLMSNSCYVMSCHAGVFEGLLSPEHDAVISDELNHASIIDGQRLLKEKNRKCKYRYKHNGEQPESLLLLSKVVIFLV